jgi:hypothetical protein
MMDAWVGMELFEIQWRSAINTFEISEEKSEARVLKPEAKISNISFVHCIRGTDCH